MTPLVLFYHSLGICCVFCASVAEDRELERAQTMSVSLSIVVLLGGEAPVILCICSEACLRLSVLTSFLHAKQCLLYLAARLLALRGGLFAFLVLCN